MDQLNKLTQKQSKDLKTLETWRASYKKSVNFDSLTEEEKVTSGIQEEYNRQNEKGMKRLAGYG